MLKVGFKACRVLVVDEFCSMYSPEAVFTIDLVFASQPRSEVQR